MSKFAGFDKPSQNYSKLPHAFIEQLPIIDSMAELKVVIYLLRHTWGFSEYGKPKRITTDEFMNGRKRKNGKRMDAGTGMSNNSVITGLEKAVEHGFILVEKDETDKARIEKYYCLNMSDLDVQDLHSGMEDLHTYPQELHSDYAESAQRSEKETLEINLEKEDDTYIDILRSISFMLFDNDWHKWMAFEKVLRAAKLAVQDSVLTVSGLGMKAAYYEDRFTRSFNRQLVVNTRGGFTSLTFQE